MSAQVRELAATTSPGVPLRPTVLVPLGSTEQHGPHLPLDTDTVIATAVASAAAQRLVDGGFEVLVAPALSYGSSGEHQDFAGTSSIGTSVLHDVLIELTRSMATWAGHVVFVNGHGGNLAALRGAVDQLAHEGHAVSWVACTTEPPSHLGADLHAGRTETSLMLHLATWNVRLVRAEAGNTAPLAELMPAMRRGGIQAVSPNGVLGDPAGATAAEGMRTLHAMTDDVVRHIKDLP